MRQSKATVNFRFRRILRREEGVKLFFAVDRAGIGIAKFQRPLVKILLGSIREFPRRGKRIRSLPWPASLSLTDRAGLPSPNFFQVARAKLNSDWNALLDPFPISHPPPNWRRSDFHLKREIGVFICAKLGREFVASFQYLAPRFFLRRDR